MKWTMLGFASGALIGWGIRGLLLGWKTYREIDEARRRRINGPGRPTGRSRSEM